MPGYPEFKNKVVLITGAASGIGRATAVRFAWEGARVAVCDRDAAGGAGTVQQVEAAGGQGLFVPVDVTVEAEVAAAVQRTQEHFGRLDLAFNNAGITQSPQPLHQQSSDVYDRVFGVSARGLWLCMKYQVQAMLETGGGAIVNMSSISGVTAAAGLATYTGAKHAALGLTRGAALDYARRGIRINGVGPGTVDTPMIDEFLRLAGDPGALDAMRAAHPIGRTGRPEEVAEAVLWLCSEASSFVVGHLLMVDGGYSIQ